MRDHGEKVLRYPVTCQGYTDEPGLGACPLRHSLSSIRAAKIIKRCELRPTTPEGASVDSGRIMT